MWNDIKDSKWIGGTSEGWERFPYYLNGLIPLAYALNDEEMIEKTKRYVYAIMDSQREDGKICPKDDTDNQASDIWSMFLVLKTLAIYGELSDDPRAVEVIKKGIAFIDKSINGTTIINWGHARYFECYVPIYDDFIVKDFGRPDGTIDTEAMEAYNPDTNALANRQVTGDYSKIKLEPGENDLRFSGDLSKATVTKYKRWL